MTERVAPWEPWWDSRVEECPQTGRKDLEMSCQDKRRLICFGRVSPWVLGGHCRRDRTREPG